VSWDSERKKQVWTYIGKIDTNAEPDIVGKQLTNLEQLAVERMLSWVINRKQGQSGWVHRGIAKRLREIV
jgi:hypothetical protein